MNILASDGSAFVCPKDLAFALGDADAAIFLQQIHYWLERESGKVIDGARWIYNTYSQWLEEFPHLTEWRLRSIIKLLRSHDVLKVAQHEKKQYKRRCWYTIDYESLKALLGSSREFPTNRKRGISPIESEDSNDSSSTKNPYSKNTPREDSNADAVGACVKEDFFDNPDGEEQVDNSSSTVNKEEERSRISGVEDRKGQKNVPTARDNNNLYILQAYGFELTKQLAKIAEKYEERVIKRSLEYLDECKRKGQEIQKELGWLTECLKNEWWKDSFKSREERAVIEGLDNEGVKLNNPTAFFEKLWELFDGGYIEPLPDGWIFDGQLSSLVHYTDEKFYVNWYDVSIQKKLDQGMFQTITWQHALELLEEECN